MDWDTNGEMNKKLLYKTLRVYLIFSVLVVLLTVPLFYYIINGLNIKDTDESLKHRKNDFLHYSLPQINTQDIPVWNKLNRSIKIEPRTSALKKDTIFYSEGFNVIENEMERYRILNVPITIESKPYLLVSKINLMESEDLLENIAILFITILILLLSGLYVITRAMSLKLWKPFYDTLHLIEQFEVDKYIEPLFPSTQIEEFNRLNESLSKLFSRNTKIFNSQREFVENAAHELQTPLAVFQAKIELLSQRSDLTEPQSEILDKLNDVISRFNKLNKNLLLLSKLESGQFEAREEILLNTIFEKQLWFFKEQAEEQNLEITFECTENVSLNANSGLLEVLVSNLFLNAIAHNRSNGYVRISLTAQTLVFENTGNESPLESIGLFQRFAKGKHSPKGNGLGLAIVKKIVDQHDWQIQYIFQNKLHIFLLDFRKF